MLGTGTRMRTTECPHNQGDTDVSIRHIGNLGRLIHQLVQRESNKVKIHDLDHGAQASHGSTDRHAHDGRLANWSAATPPLTEVLLQSHGCAEGTARLPHILPEDADVLILLEFFTQRSINRLPVLENGHVQSSNIFATV